MRRRAESVSESWAFLVLHLRAVQDRLIAISKWMHGAEAVHCRWQVERPPNTVSLVYRSSSTSHTPHLMISHQRALLKSQEQQC